MPSDHEPCPRIGEPGHNTPANPCSVCGGSGRVPENPKPNPFICQHCGGNLGTLSPTEREARARDTALIEAAEIARHEIMVRAKAEKMGARLHDPDGSLMGHRVAGAIVALCSENAWRIK